MISNSIWILAGAWSVLILFSSYLGIFRALVDRIRSGLSSSPTKTDSVSKLITRTLALPNHERPFHIEASFLSSTQIITGFSFILSLDLWENTFASLLVAFVTALLVERLSAWLYPRNILQSKHMQLHLKIGLFMVKFTTLLCKPLDIILCFSENLFQSSGQKSIQAKEEENEVADHIRIVGREGSNIDPDVLEIMGNTLEMSQLKIKDAMIPRNQVQILDVHDSYQKNLEITKVSGHTRLPLCEGNLDHCLGIIHVKHAFRTISDAQDTFDLHQITKSPTLLNNEEFLPVALKKMMKLKVHMALVKDEFGGIDGVITLEDILEEVVGEIQDEFDSEEEDVEKLSDGVWKISGLTALHELPEELGITDEDPELSSLGGMLTQTIGKIPENGEVFDFPHFKVEILDADDTRVQSVKIMLHQPSTASKKA